MAESPENKKTTINNLADELDAMLDETESSIDLSNELIDDEDAIDRLLMDNAFESSEENEEDEFADIDDLISDSLDDNNEGPHEALSDEFADEVVETGMPQQGFEVDEFGEDEFGDQEEWDGAETDDKFQRVVDDKDEVVDEALQNNVSEAEDVKEEARAVSELDIAENEFDQVDDQLSELDVVAPEPIQGVEAASASEAPNNVVDLSEINTQLVALQHTQDTFEQQLASLQNNNAVSMVQDELEGLRDANSKQQRRLAQLEKQKPTMAYVALGFSIVALVVGGSLGFVGFGADAKTATLNETVISLEEQLDAWIAKQNGGSELQTITTRLNQMDMEVAGFSARLEALQRQQESVAEQGNQEVQPDRLKQLSEQIMQTAALVETLQLKVDKLMNKKQAAPRKANVVKDNWVVNLVSFKQEWYAKRKAAEYQKQGVPVEMTGTSIKGENWYRLRVAGFKSKYEAAAYAAKVKKTLNLTSVWVTKD